MSTNKNKNTVEKTKKRIYLQKDVDNITVKVRETAKKQLLESAEYQQFIEWKVSTEQYIQKLAMLKEDTTFYQKQIKKYQELIYFLEDKALVMNVLIKENVRLEALDFIMSKIDNDKPLIEEVEKFIKKHSYLKQNNVIPKQIVLNVE